MEYNIKAILDGLKQRIINDELIIQTPGGNIEKANFYFLPPAKTEEIDRLSTLFQVNLPQEYREFLLQHNGAKLFDIGFGECTDIYSINEIVEIAELMPDIVPNFIPVARHPSCTIYIDTNREKRYMFSQAGGSEFSFLAMGFEEWIEMLILSNGNYFEERIPQLLFRTIDDSELKIKKWLIDGYKL